MDIPKPSNGEVAKYIESWGKLENYVWQESSLKKLFTETYPQNTDLNEILIKASSLNDFYSTNIFSVYPVAKHIFDLKIDSKLKAGDPSLVAEIANVTIKEKPKNFYSFASKYCSHHCPENFPIYDFYVEKLLMYFKKKFKFSQFKKEELKDYSRFKQILNDFKAYFGINYSLKEIDQYLWQLGKEYFPRKY